MTKRDFEALAKAMLEIESHPVRITCSNKIADVCAKLNPAFDRDLFLRACNAQAPSFTVTPAALSVLVEAETPTFRKRSK